MIPDSAPNPPIADILAIAAHRDDVEQTCGGTLLRMGARGLRTAILDLTKGEAGTRGSAEERAHEAAEAAHLLGVAWRQALDLPDGAVENTLENRLKIVHVLRILRPRVVILPYWQARHPDHATTATLGYEACFLSGLTKIEDGATTASPLQDRLRQPLRRRASQLCRGYYALHRAAPRRVDGLPLAIRQPGGRLADSLSLKKRFASVPLPRPATTGCWPVCATESPLCKRKWAWWTT